MKLRHIAVLTIAGAMTVLCLAGCSDAAKMQTVSGAGLEQLGQITVITREEGSGTREVFAESVGFYDASTGRDRTLDSAKQAESGTDVIDLVSSEKSAIGYVSLGALDGGNSKALHTVTVDGKSLDRKFYLAYSGSLSDLEQDFLAYVKGAGQALVGENFTAVNKTTSFLSLKPSGSLRIGGSTSVSGLMQELAQAYMEYNPNASVEVVETDSTNGLTGAMSGIYDLGMSSRELKDYEKELLQYEVIAKDEIAVIVNKDNSLENISSEDLKAVYTGEIANWKELNQ